ncbi:MAG: TraV family lipoprotein [Nitrospiria bacterium]
MKLTCLFLAGLLALALTGCYHYACPAPDGTTCKSISEIYQMANDGRLKTKKSEDADRKRSAAKIRVLPARLLSATAPAESDEIKPAPQQILPVKLFKYVDSDGDLHYPGYVFVLIRKSPWSAPSEEILPASTPLPRPAGIDEPKTKTGPENANLTQPAFNAPSEVKSLDGLNFQTGGINLNDGKLTDPTGNATLSTGGTP